MLQLKNQQVQLRPGAAAKLIKCNLKNSFKQTISYRYLLEHKVHKYLLKKAALPQFECYFKIFKYGALKFDYGNFFP